MKNFTQFLKRIRCTFIVLTGLLLLLSMQLSAQTVTTNKTDYLPGETVLITGSGWTAGETVNLVIEHQIFTEHPDEYLTAVANTNGTISNNEYVILEWDLGETFLLTATGETGTATTTFTDAGGAYTLKFSAADPVLYIPSIPYPASLTAPTGRGNGEILIPHAQFNDGSNDVKVESLAPETMALGQIVPFEIKIKVAGAVTPENGVITLVIGWNTLTTNSNDFGYDSRPDDIGYGVYGAFIDIGDGAYTDGGAQATVTNFIWSIINDEIVGVFTVSGLDNGDEVVMETWMVLDDDIPSGTGGNVQSRLIDAATGSDQTINVANSGTITLVNGDNITTGNQTVPLLRTKEFFTSDVELSVTKTDDIDPIGIGETLTYTVTAFNAGPAVANSVVVYDVLDPNVTFVSASDGGFINTDAGDLIPDGAVQWNVGGMAAGETVSYTIAVTVNNNAPATGTGGAGNATSCVTGADLCNYVVITTISDDIDLSNNQYYEPTGVNYPTLACKEFTNIIAPTCVDGNDASATANFNGGVAPYTYLWDNGETEQTAVNLTPGVHTVDITDSNGHTITCNVTIPNAVPNPPVINCPGDAGPYTCTDDIATLFNAWITDLTNITEDVGTGTGTVTLSYKTDPLGSDISLANLTAPGICDGGSVTVYVYAVDECGETGSCNSTFTVTGDNTPPLLADAPAAVTVECIEDVPDMISLAYTDNCSDAGTVLGVDGPLVGDACGGTITRTWNVSDDCGNPAVTRTQIITIDDTQAPVLADAPADVTVECIEDVPAMISLAYTDNCSDAGTVLGVDGPLVGDACGGTITRTWNVSDDCGNPAVTRTQIITIDDTQAPVLADAPAAVTVECIEDVPDMISLAYTDNCSDAGTVLGVDGPLVGDACGGTITRTWNVSDDCGNPAVTRTQIITIDDTQAPVLADAPAAVTVECIEDVPDMISLAYTDNCSDAGTVLGVDGPLVGDACGGTITRTWNVSDDCGNPAVTRTQIITIDDTQAPVLADAPADVTVECIEDVPDMISLAYTDNCSDAGTVLGVDGPLVGDACGGTITRTWNVSDDCGNPAVTRTQIITIDDTQAPVLADAPADVTVECIEDVPDMISLAYTDNCSDAGTVLGVDGNLLLVACLRWNNHQNLEHF